jgi:hypothetical protein
MEELPFCLTIGKEETGTLFMAIISSGIPHKHKNVTVLAVEMFSSVEDAEEWFFEMVETQPWNTRH